MFSGLPGIGKSTIARELARQIGAVYLRADTIEQALRDDGLTDEEIGGKGYVVGYRLAEENLLLGRDVVADQVNPWPLTRNAWRNAGLIAGALVLEVEVVCSDLGLHRQRLEGRDPGVADLAGPTWEEVLARDYLPWDRSVLTIDTATVSQNEAVALIRRALG